MLYMAATFKPSLFGIFSFVIITVEIMSSVGDVGLTRFGARALIRDEIDRERMTGIFLSIQMLTSVVLMALGYATLFIISPEEMKKELFMVALLTLFFSSFIYTTETVFTAEKRFGTSALFQVLGKVVYLVLGFTALLLGYSAMAVIIALVIGMAVESVARMIYMRLRITTLSGAYSVEEFMHVVKGTIPFAVSGIAVLVYYRADIIILGLIKGDYEVGIYSAAYSFFTFFFWMPVILSRTLLPGLIERYKQEREAALRSSIEWYRSVIFGGIAIAFTITVMAQFIFDLLLPAGDYQESILVLQILIWSMPLLMMVSVGINALVMTSLERASAATTVVTMVAVIILDLALIPSYGVNGAAVAMLIATAIWALQGLWLLKRRVWRERTSIAQLFLLPFIGLAAVAAAGLVLEPQGAIVELAGGLAVLSLVVYASTRLGEDWSPAVKK
jgi:O-antigen/teichoic acid export membrane protein